MYVRYFYPDGIKYDGSSTPQIDGAISKKTFILLYKDTTLINTRISR